MSQSLASALVLSIFAHTWLSAESKVQNVTISSFVDNYHKGVQAYLDEDWQNCIELFEEAVQGYTEMKKATVKCRLRCQNEVEEESRLTPKSEEDLYFYEKLVRKTLCLIKCKKVHFNQEESFVPKDMIENFENLKAYEYMQLCYYQKNMPQKAASSVFTFLVTNPGHESMLSNLKFYTSLPEVKVDDIVNFEAKPYVPLYVHGSEAYRNSDYKQVINYFEESLKEYLEAEEVCRIYCEGSFDQGWFPDFTSSIANHFTYCLKCKRRCPSQLNNLNGEVHQDLLASQYHFLQFAYFKVGDLRKACEAVESYLLFFPSDETMINNKILYKQMPDVKDKYFTPREEALKYVKRQEYETKLLSFIEKEFLFDKDEANVIDEYESS